MALTWVRNTDQQTVTANNSAGTEKVLIDNVQLPEHMVTIVDGIITLATDNDDMWAVRLLHLPQMVALTDLSASSPDESDRMIFYYWHCVRGPLVFRLRAKRTLHPGERLVLQTWKETGSTDQALKVGYQIAYVDH